MSDAAEHQMSNPQAEAAVVGACLQSLDAVFDAAELVTPDDFKTTSNGHLFAAMVEMVADGQTAVDSVTVGSYLAAKGIGPDIISQGYMDSCKAACDAVGHVKSYAGEVAEHAERRRLLTVAAEIRTLAMSGGKSTALIAAAEEKLFAVAHSVRRESTAATVDEMLPGWLETIDERWRRYEAGTPTVGTSTGLTALDDMIDGLVGGRLYVVGAPPGTGKSSLVLRFAESVSCDFGLPTLGHSVEMNQTEVMDRFMSGRAGVPSDVIKHGNLTADDWDRINSVREAAPSWPLVIDTSKELTVTDIYARARRVAAQHDGKLGLIFLDYFQLVEAAQAGRGNLSDSLAEMSRRLKVLAGQFNVPVVVLSQLVKSAADGGSDVRINGSMLKGTGALQADADVVMLLKRPDMNHDAPEAVPGVTHIIVDKNRHGATGVVEAAFLGRYTAFRDLENGSPPRMSEYDAPSPAGGEWS